jgi:general L-amino acid transport system permease protein
VFKVLLPQAFRHALPATINQFVITFKETSVVVIIGFFDIMASGNAAFGTGEWTGAYVEVYVFIAFIYFLFVFGLSRYGAFLESRMRVGQA